MNPRNSIWHDVPALNEYIARCQSFLQSCKSDNDVLLYWPVADFWSEPSGRVQPMGVSETNWFTDQPIGKTARALWNRGYAFDYVSDRQLLAAKVKDGAIQMPGGNYKVIVVPECKFIPLETFKQLLALATNGATIVFENDLPKDVSGANNLENERAEFNELKSKLSFLEVGPVPGPMKVAKVGRGGVECSDLLSLPASGETLVSSGLSYARRSFDGGWNYFIVNRGGTNFNGWVTLGRAARSAAILDPITGRTGMAATRQNATNAMQVYLQLATGESVILRAFQDEPLAGPAWSYWQTNGRPFEIAGRWNVKFIQGGPTLPADFQTPKPASWTTFPDTNAQAFAGSAGYSITFDAPSGGDKNYSLDLGDVHQSARVRVNGKDYGVLITSPFRVVVDNLKPTGNTLEVEVTSVSANRIRDLDRRGIPWKIFKDINFVNVNYRPFDASNWPLTDSGLLGPVTLTALRPWINLAPD
jgi:hypothetical protein